MQVSPRVITKKTKNPKIRFNTQPFLDSNPFVCYNTPMREKSTKPSDGSFLKHMLDALENAKQSREFGVVNGIPESYDEYREAVGYIKACQEAQEIVRQSYKKFFAEY